MNRFNISILEQSLMKIVKEIGVSSTVYFDRPKAASHQEDFCVVKVGGNITDSVTHGICRVYINLFAKDHDSQKNNAKLKVMQDKVITSFPTSYDVYDGATLIASYLFDDAPKVVADKADDFGYHMRMINIETTIKAI